MKRPSSARREYFRGESIRGESMNSLKAVTIIILGSLVLSACADLGVKPWERDVLARPEMQLNHDPIEAGLDDHIYFSKEASSGGRGFGGGGCGCN
jgi:hypothetical protein